MRVLKYKDISTLIEKIISQNESIDPTVGDGPDQISVIKQGLKIRHIPSGLIYTVTNDVDEKADPIVIFCHRPGKDLVIQGKDFNEYERL